MKRLAIIILLFIGFCLGGYSQFQTNGNAVQLVPNEFQLTTYGGWEFGSLWHYPKTNFNKEFKLKTQLYFGTDPFGADGIVFVIQNACLNAGTYGGGIGYGGINNSLGVEFDTWQNTIYGDPPYDHISIEENGVVDHTLATTLGGPVQASGTQTNIKDGAYHDVTIWWQPGSKNLSIYFDNATTPRLTVNVDLVNSILAGNPYAYWGFTSATGGSMNEHKVKFNPPPNIDTTICQGSKIQYNADDAVTVNTYKWSPNYNISDVNSPNPFLWPDITTVYTLAVTDGCGITANVNITVNVKPGPTAVTTGDKFICPGGTTNLSASGGGTYQWSDGLGTGTTYAVSPPSTKTYIVTVTNAIGCTDTASQKVTVYTPPVPITNNDTAICTGNPISLEAKGGASYTWDNGIVTNPTVLIPLVNKKYTVTVTDSHSCTAVKSVNISVNPNPIASTDGDKSICPGKSATLTALGGTTYLWSDGLGTNPSAIASPLTSKTYYVTVFNAFGCPDSANQKVIVYTNPVITVNNDTSICAGGSAHVEAKGGLIYEWDNSIGFVNPMLLTPASSAKYTVTVTDNHTCTATKSVQINVNPNPIASTGPDQYVCTGKLATLTASGGGTYLWSDGLGTIANPSFTPVTNKTYYVTVTNAFNCSDSANQKVFINGNPTITVNNDTSICLGGSVTLNAKGGISYFWDNGIGAVNPTLIKPISSKTYTVTVTDAQSCTAVKPVSITVNPLPNPVVGLDKSICPGDIATLTISGGGTYLWSGGIGTSTSESVSPLINTTYYVTITNAFNCAVVDSQKVVVNPKPIASTLGDQYICPGKTATLTASGGNSYFWSDALGVNSTESVSPAITKTYTVTVTNINGCTDIANQKVIVYPNPTITLSGDIAICNGNSTIIEAKGGFSYNWDNGIGNVNPATVKPISLTKYTVTVTDNNTCTGTQSLQVTVNPLPIPVVGIDKSICPGDFATLSISGGGTYLWSDGIGSSASESVSPLINTTYYVTTTNTFSCAVVDSEKVVVNPKPTASTLGDQFICPGRTATLTALGGTSYLWSDALGVNSTQSVSPALTKTYTVTVTNVNGCTDIANQKVFVYPDPIITLSGDIAICSGKPTIIQAFGGLSYNWDNGIGNINPVSVNPPSLTKYTVTVTDNNTCTGSKSLTVSVNPNPLPTMADQQICLGNSTTLSPGNSYNSYRWTNGEITPALTVYTSGNYNVTVTNGFACTGTAMAAINYYPAVAVNEPILEHPKCAGDQDGKITINSVIPATLYSYKWDNTSTANPLIGGDGSYTVTITSSNGCTLTKTATLTEPQPLLLTVIGTPDSICTGDTAFFNSTVIGGTMNYTYRWSNSNTNANFSKILINSSTYTLTVTDAHSCTAVQPGSIYVTPKTPIDFQIDKFNGCVPLTIHFDETSAPNGQHYTWFFGNIKYEMGADLKGVYTFKNAGVYSMAIKSTEAGCFRDTTISTKITVYPKPTPQFTTNPLIADQINNEVDFYNSSVNATQYFWNFGDTTKSELTNPKHRYINAGEYAVWLKAISINGCEDSIMVPITVKPVTTFFAPSGFTPSGSNPLFSPKAFGVNLNYWDLMIFDRWGEMIYESTIYGVNDYTGKITVGWDGTVNNGTTIAPEDVYVWVAKWIDINGKIWEKIGRVSLIR